ADIAFSIDSILAAVAMAEEMSGLSESEKILMVVTGGILGIITMRFVAGYFITLLERFRGLEAGAYALVAWIGLKLVASGLHTYKLIPVAINEWTFWGGMLAIVVVSLAYKPREKPPPSAEDTAIVEEVARIAGGEGEGGPGRG
ncbi:MAG: hypothetical protein LC745_04315, partial [Planctomycetia bacterium]|nr:hypothetical protein [Planctomycetia bacterium]